MYYSLFLRSHTKNYVYISGDTDGCVPYVGTENWTRGLNYTVVNDWHQV